MVRKVKRIYASEEDQAYKMLVLSWDLNESVRMGLIDKQFAKYALMKLGIETGYYVINWLPLYNYTAGILTVFITAILIWRNNKLALPAAIATFSAHASVMLILLIAYRGVVSAHSLEDMTVRIVAWAIILTLMFFQSRKNREINLHKVFKKNPE